MTDPMRTTLCVMKAANSAAIEHPSKLNKKRSSNGIGGDEWPPAFLLPNPMTRNQKSHSPKRPPIPPR